MQAGGGSNFSTAWLPSEPIAITRTRSQRVIGVWNEATKEP
jgi:hypothetical protein